VYVPVGPNMHNVNDNMTIYAPKAMSRNLSTQTSCLLFPASATNTATEPLLYNRDVNMICQWWQEKDTRPQLYVKK